MPREPMVRSARGADGALTTMIELTPSHLPPVLRRDIDRAWELARIAARAGKWGQPRGFRLRADDGGWIDFSVGDRDAGAWVTAIERGVGGLGSAYAIALCLRLLALIDLLGRATWARGLFRLERDGAALDAGLLAAAATVPLTPEGRFDDHLFHARLLSAGSVVPGVSA